MRETNSIVERIDTLTLRIEMVVRQLDGLSIFRPAASQRIFIAALILSATGLAMNVVAVMGR